MVKAVSSRIAADRLRPFLLPFKIGPMNGREVRQSGLRLKARQLRSLGNIKRIIHASPQVRSASDPSHPLDSLNSDAKCNPRRH